MNPFVCLLLFCLCASAAVPPQIAAVIERASHAPAEFAADSLIRIAALDKLDKSTRIELLEDAFRRAADAQQPLRRGASILHAGGPAGLLNHAYQQELDALSLRLRAVNEMLSLDPAKASELFQRIPRPQVPKLRCDDYLVYDVSLYYEVLGKVARQQSQPVRLLNQATLGMTSPSQVEPVTRLFAGAEVKDADFQVLLTSLVPVLGKIYGDDRAFTFAAASTGPAIQALVDEARHHNLSPLPLIEAYRLYLMNNLAGERCADDELMANGQTFTLALAGPPDPLGAAAADFFNQRLRTPPLPPLREEEITPSKIQGAASGLRSCEDADCQQLAAGYRDLIFGDAGVPLTDAARETPAWRDKLDQFLAAMANWKQASGLAASEQFGEKCQIFSNLIGVVPAGAARERVVRAWIDYLQLNPFERENRMEWFLPVNTLIGRVGMDPAGLGSLAGQLRQSPDPVIALYAALEVIAPRTPDRILSLL